MCSYRDLMCSNVWKKYIFVKKQCLTGILILLGWRWKVNYEILQRVTQERRSKVFDERNACQYNVLGPLKCHYDSFIWNCKDTQLKGGSHWIVPLIDILVTTDFKGDQSMHGEGWGGIPKPIIRSFVFCGGKCDLSHHSKNQPPPPMPLLSYPTQFF